MSHVNSLNSQRGTAIIIALFVMTIAVAASIVMMTRLQVDIRRTEALLNTEQTAQYVQGSVAWAIDKLTMDWQQKKPDQVVDKTPITTKEENVNGYKIQSIIFDAQRLFNLNNLTVADYQFDFLHLIKTIEPKLKNADATKITIAIHDWLSPNNNTEVAAYYAGLNPGYKSPHAPMASVSELRLIKGITPDLYNKLLPYIIVLPATTPINVNNAPAQVLMSLSQHMSFADTQKLIELRKQTPFLDPQSFGAVDVIKNNHIDNGKITVVSNYFLVETKVSIGQQQTILYTLLSRATQGPKSAITVLWQLKGTL
ncbi:MAG: type II secretion system minor pseudopilin GspK [Pseudomonadota bacterium]